jgi:hypothetical protein
MNIKDTKQIMFDFQEVPESHFESKTVVAYSDHNLPRLNVLNSRGVKIPRVVDFVIEDRFCRLTSRMSNVHLTIMELIFKLSGDNVVQEKTGTTTFFFDMTDLIKHYPVKTNSSFLIQKIQELGGGMNEKGEKTGTFLQTWDLDSSIIGIDSEVSSASGVVLKSGYADGKSGNAYIVRKDNPVDARLSSGLKNIGKTDSKSTKFYFYVMFSTEWIDFIRASKLLKVATLKAICETGAITNVRLQSIVRFMSAQKPGVSRSLSYLIEKLDLMDGVSPTSWRTVRLRLLEDIGKEQHRLLSLGIDFDFSNEMFVRISNHEVSVIENS